MINMLNKRRNSCKISWSVPTTKRQFLLNDSSVCHRIRLNLLLLSVVKNRVWTIVSSNTIEFVENNCHFHEYQRHQRILLIFSFLKQRKSIDEKMFLRFCFVEKIETINVNFRLNRILFIILKITGLFWCWWSLTDGRKINPKPHWKNKNCAENDLKTKGNEDHQNDDEGKKNENFYFEIIWTFEKTPRQFSRSDFTIELTCDPFLTRSMSHKLFIFGIIRQFNRRHVIPILKKTEKDVQCRLDILNFLR